MAAEPASPVDEQPAQNALQTLRDSLDHSTSTPEFSAAITTLADKSRLKPSVRHELADPPILRQLLGCAKDHVDQSSDVTTAVLRCIGNASIDNNDARDILTDIGFGWARQYLQCGDDELKWLTVKVLYNICSDHEDAQQRCYRDLIHYDLIRIGATPQARDNNDLTLMIDLLFWVTGHKSSEADMAEEPLPTDTLLELLNLPYYHATITDIDAFAILVEICLTFLRDPAIQTRVISLESVEHLWRMFEQVRKQLCGLPDDSTESRDLLKPLLSSLTWCLSDTAANPRFAQRYGLDHPFIKGLIFVIKSRNEETVLLAKEICSMIVHEGAGHDTPLEARAVQDGVLDVGYLGHTNLACACQIVGNLVRDSPTEASADLVEEEMVHAPLWKSLVSQAQPVDEETVHSIAGLLVQLTRPSSHVRDVMGEDENAETALGRMYEHKTPQLKQDAVRLVRALGKECPNNQERFGRLAALMTSEAAEKGSGMPAVGGA